MAPSQSQRRRSGAPSEGAASRRRNDESWVEIASQPSSSSLSSIDDEMIVTTGLRVGAGDTDRPRNRRLQYVQRTSPAPALGQGAGQAGTSSQEEYDESESEDDRVMTSSNEHLATSTPFTHQQRTIVTAADSSDDDDGEGDDDDDDDDENATALGRPSDSPTFRPQPNAFSHPPSHLHRRATTSSSHPRHPHHPAHHSHPSFFRPSASPRSHPRSHRHFMSPSYQADNDAALRASLTTLLSCAAAARGLPKKEHELDGPSAVAGPSGLGAGVLPASQPMELRLVPESELMAPPPAAASGRPSSSAAAAAAATAAGSPSSRPRSSSSSSSPSHGPPRQRGMPAEKTKRPSSGAQQPSRPPRATKKKRTNPDVDSQQPMRAAAAELLGPSALTWVVSAGVLVLVSVVGFGAGYVIGREVGRQETASLWASGGAAGAGFSPADGAANASSCGRELVRSTASGGGGTLRRFKWGAVAKSVTA